MSEFIKEFVLRKIGGGGGSSVCFLLFFVVKYCYFFGDFLWVFEFFQDGYGYS